MRERPTLAASLLLLSTHAQWPTTPQDPLVVCNHPSDQRQEIRVMAEPDGGWLVLWRDDREGPRSMASTASGSMCSSCRRVCKW